MPLFLSRPPTNYTLHPHRVDIWQVTLDTQPAWALNVLNREEKARAQRFYFPHHTRRFTVAHAALRWILSRYLACRPEALVFTSNYYGKPSAVNALNLEFNLSHSGETALIAVGNEHTLGVDLEFFSKRPYRTLAANLFSPEEITSLSQATPHSLPTAFFHIWAQKEAFIKACGRGLSYPLERMTAALYPENSRYLTDVLTQTPWHLQAFTPAPHCAAALCTHPEVCDFYYHNGGLPDDL